MGVAAAVCVARKVRRCYVDFCKLAKDEVRVRALPRAAMRVVNEVRDSFTLKLLFGSKSCIHTGQCAGESLRVR